MTVPSAVRICLALTLPMLLGKSGGPASAFEGPPIDLSRYELVFADEFDSLDVSATGPGTRWIAHTPWNGDFGDARFANPGPGGPFQVHGGMLSIEARKTADGSWQSGLLASVDGNGDGFSAQYGYFEIRAKLPPGKGLWPAFWLDAWKPKGSTVPSLEVDVFEHYGHFPSDYHATVHIWPTPAGEDDGARKAFQTLIDVPAGSLYSGFHTYGADVEPDWITIYLDRVPRWRCPTPPVHKDKLMILVDLGMGSGWPIAESPDPSVMYVDYIRAWRRRG